MRSAFAVAALIAGATAVPYQKRAVVTNYEVVYETAYVTVTHGAEPTSAVDVAPAAETSVVEENNRKGRHGHGHGWTWKYGDRKEEPVSEAETEPVTTEVAEAPEPEPTTEAPEPTTEAPEPEPTTEAPEPTTEAPEPTTQAPEPTQAYEAPVSYDEPEPEPAPVSSEEPAPSSADSAGAAPTSYAEIATYHHNLHRANHSADPLEWDSELADCAAEIASSCVYAHNVEARGGGYGQNIAAGVEAGNVSAVITDLFYNGEVNLFEGLYNQDNPDMSNFEEWGHFSQIVWKGTTKLGCATHDCSGQGLANVGSTVSPYFTVCNYKSPGNYAGEYADNVGEPLEKATVYWDAGLNA
ncbi:hypothetical protein MBLNU230_g5794t1 [Neophaeotheca triangularis]